MSWFSRKAPVVEAVAAPPQAEPPDIEREGYEWGIPAHGQTRQQTQERRSMMEDLADLADQCVPISACRVAISKAVTAAGLEIVANDNIPEDQIPDTLPPEVLRLTNLLRFVNAREDMVQLARGIAEDLLTFGDSYVEVGCVLGEPAALWSLPAPTMSVKSDEHGNVEGYKQELDSNRIKEFKPEQVIHFTLDSLRGGPVRH